MPDPFPDITQAANQTAATLAPAADTLDDLWRVWRTDKRYRLVHATNERQALRKVRHSVKATLLDQRQAS